MYEGWRSLISSASRLSNVHFNQKYSIFSQIPLHQVGLCSYVPTLSLRIRERRGYTCWVGTLRDSLGTSRSHGLFHTNLNSRLKQPFSKSSAFVFWCVYSPLWGVTFTVTIVMPRNDGRQIHMNCSGMARMAEVAGTGICIPSASFHVCVCACALGWRPGPPSLGACAVPPSCTSNLSVSFSTRERGRRELSMGGWWSWNTQPWRTPSFVHFGMREGETSWSRCT